MAKKEFTTVELEAPTAGGPMLQKFDPLHAERILRMGFDRSGWRLPGGSPWAYDPVHGLTRAAGGTERDKR